jgi:cation-transporting ATPase E
VRRAVEEPGEALQPRPAGLTTFEALDRADRGLANVDTTKRRTDGEVIRANTLTFFNLVLGSLILILFVLAIVDLDIGHFQDGVFVGIVVAANVAIATFQELRAAKTLRELAALSSPRATVVRDGQEVSIPAEQVVQGDLLHLERGHQVVADGKIVGGAAEIDESLLTGESDPGGKAPGDPLLSGSFCTSGSCYYRAERVGTEAYAVQLAAEARSLVRRLSPLQLRFKRLVRVLLGATAVLGAMLLVSFNVEDRGLAEAIKAATATIATIVPEGLILAVTVAFAIGAVRVSRAKALVQDITAVEALNYVDVICLDKTGTLTANELTLRTVHWASGAQEAEPWLAAFATAMASESKTTETLAEALARRSHPGAQPEERVPFSSDRRWSALRLRVGEESRAFLLGAPETLLPLSENGDVDGTLLAAYDEAVAAGFRGVLFAEIDALPVVGEALARPRPLALITLSDVLRPEVHEAFAMMAELGIEPKLISGDNPETVLALATQIGITMKGGAISGADLEALDDERFAAAVEEHSVFGRITPAQKARIVSQLRTNSHFVAMVGDGANDVRALHSADVAVAMISGTETARAVSGIVLLDDSFEALIRAAKEAKTVVGNVTRLSKLFITKSLYAYLIIVATNMLGLDFPFLPRQGSLTSLLTLGIPTVFISMSVPPPDAGRDFTASVLRFALPASLSLAAAGIAVSLFTQGLLGRSVEETRTLVSLTIGITGVLFMVEVLGFEGFQGLSIRNLTRPLLTSALGALLLTGFVLTLYTPLLRKFFDFTEMGPGQWAIVVPAVVAALVGQFYISRYWPQIIDWLTAKPPSDEAERGRAWRA